MYRRRALRPVSILGLLAVANIAFAQDSATFGARLDWVPISGAERNDVAGTGSVSATLSRSRLSLTGCFEGLPAAATRASLHQGVATGARGPAIAELTLTANAAGTLTGNVDLSREQRAALLAGHLYIQLHAARGVAPDNAVLWGWLLASQTPPGCATTR
jgi:CHRD domain